MTKTILVIGTFDTKDAELRFVCDRIHALGGRTLTMDVSVLGDATGATDISKHDVAEAGGSNIAAAIASDDENTAMQLMTRGAAALCTQWHAQARFDGMIALGGSMGTDLALDCAQALPMGVPKYVVSTVAFSPIIPPDRLSPDIQMILWAGGLYGLNSVCKSALAQAAGAVLGAAQAAMPPRTDRPVIGMTSLGSSCLKYMTHLLDPLEQRGFEVAVFHATGMGGMAFEALAKQGYFAAVMDFALSELGNLMVGSVLNAG
ncbi:MAG: Tm-1-like ATP-binding domain-containing protein, partial [Pseudomonadota bacterium]